MKRLLSLLLVVSTAAAQSVAVTTIADSGPGSLRAAILAANASGAASFTIDVTAGATSGSIVLATFLPSLTRSDVAITAASGAGRLVVDARGPTAAGGPGLEFLGNHVHVFAPCTVLVTQGNAFVVHGFDTRFADIEATGNVGGVGLLVTAGANDLQVGRLFLDRFQVGLHLVNCARARIADDGVAVAEVRNGTSAGIQITGGSDHVIGSFVCTLDQVGVSATNSTNLTLGRTSNPRSLVAACRQQGVLVQQCSAVAFANADLFGNGTSPSGHGFQAIGGIGCTVRDVRAFDNVSGGLVFGGGIANVWVGPGVTTRSIAGTLDVGITVRDGRAVTIVDSQFGPGHHIGVVLQPEANGVPENVTLCRCAVVGNRSTGMQFSRCIDALVSTSFVAGNLGDGIQAIGGSLATAPRSLEIAGCVLGGNAGTGLVAQSVDGVTVGPGNRIDDNIFSGLQFFACANVVVDETVSLDRNRSSGIWAIDCNGAVIARSALRDNRGTGLFAVRCSGLVFGPSNVVHGTIGTGVQLENSDGCRVSSSRITASTAYGVHVFTSFGTVGTTPHVLQSCLIADHPGLALYQAGGPPVVCQLTTIAGNLRGISSGPYSMTVDSCIVHSNLLEDLQQTATALVVRDTFHAIPLPVPGSTNTNTNPQFVSPAAKDWRLQATSPAVGFANTQTVVVAPGSLDAFAGPRVIGALDAGAYEVGPHPPAPARLTLSSGTMSNGGGGLAFHVRYPPGAAGTVSLLLMEIGPPSGSFPVLGAVIPLGLTSALFLATDDPLSVGTIATTTADGTVDGALLWGGRLPTAIQNQVVSLCAVALNATPAIAAVSNTAMFTIL